MQTKLVYVAGKFRGAENADVQRYIDVASWFRAPIAKTGCFPVCVHIGEGLAMHDLNQENNGQWWVDATLEVLRRCDALVAVPGWHTSSGTFGEMQEALRLKIPVFLAQWYGFVPENAMPGLQSSAQWTQVDTLIGEVGNCTAYAQASGLPNFDAWAGEVKR